MEGGFVGLFWRESLHVKHGGQCRKSRAIVSGTGQAAVVSGELGHGGRAWAWR